MTSTSPSLERLVAGVSLLALAGALLVGCFVSTESTGDAGNEIVIFVDFSGSMGAENRALIERDFTDSIVPSLSAGDRILVAPINEETLTNFHALLDETFPPEPEFNGWMDNTMLHQREQRAIKTEVDELRERIRSQVPEMLLKAGSSSKTDIFSSLLMAKKLFQQTERRKILILMSDMIVDYPPYRFDKISWSPEKQQELLAELQGKGLIPDLSGVCVYVTAVTAESAEMARQISGFWQDYFDRSHADLDPSRYAHVLLHWPPSDDCAS